MKNEKEQYYIVDFIGVAKRNFDCSLAFEDRIKETLLQLEQFKKNNFHLNAFSKKRTESRLTLQFSNVNWYIHPLYCRKVTDHRYLTIEQRKKILDNQIKVVENLLKTYEAKEEESLQKLKNFLKTILPEKRFDVGKIKELGFTKFTSHYTYTIVFSYPKVKIFNNKGLTHNIKDFYTLLPFTIIEGGGFSFSSALFGYKTHYSLEELNIGYIHSHLPSGVKFDLEPKLFCLGSETPIITSINNLNSLDPINWSVFLNDMTSVVGHESLRGTPYVYIKNLCSPYDSSNTTKSINNIDKAEAIKAFCDIDFPGIKIKYPTNLSKFPFVEVNQLELLRALTPFVNSKMKYINNTFYSLDTNESYLLKYYLKKKKELKNVSFIFRGVKQKITIERPTVEFKLKQKGELIADPAFEAAIERFLNLYLKKQHIYEYYD